MNYRYLVSLALCCFLIAGCAFSEIVVIEGAHSEEYELNLTEGRKPEGGDLFSEEDLRPVFDEKSVTDIVFEGGNDEAVLCSGPDESCVEIKSGLDGNCICITGSGTYRLSGETANSHIEVDASKDAQVRFLLSGVSICSEGETAIYVNSADTFYLMTEADTVNSICDTYAEVETGKNAVIVSDDDLVIQGEGCLNIRSYNGAGIECKNDVSMTGGNVRIDSADIAIMAKDSFRMCGGVLDIEAADDGIQVSNSEEAEKGYVYIGGGELTISSGDDAIHSERSFTMTEGIYTVTGSREAIEAGSVDITGGVLRLHAEDDGINASGKKIILPYIRISGGDIYIDSCGDGIDSNGILYMDGGTVFIDAPTNFGDDPLDRDMGISLSGGCIIAAMGEGSVESYAAMHLAGRKEHVIEESGESGAGRYRIEIIGVNGEIEAAYDAEDPFTKLIVYEGSDLVEIRISRQK